MGIEILVEKISFDSFFNIFFARNILLNELALIMLVCNKKKQESSLGDYLQEKTSPPTKKNCDPFST